MKNILLIFIIAIFTILQIKVTCRKIDAKLVDLTNDIQLFLKDISDVPMQSIDTEMHNIVIVKPNKHIDNDVKYDCTSEQNVCSQNLRRLNAKTAKDLKRAHEVKIKEIVKFLEDHYESTKYFFNEMRRITKTHEVKDDLRRMLDYVEGYGREMLKRSLLLCFEKIKIKHDTEQINVWNKPKPNRWIINVMDDDRFEH